jgi:alkylhydroperoxidase/carboxymuconolactone decarboxylase family protein YurZ
MKTLLKHITKVSATVFITLLSFSGIAEAQTMNNALSARQQSIITISAYTANGDLERLKTALNEGLGAGLTVNEIKEILIQLYAYTGFPRSLNGIHTFMAVMDERQAKGIKDEIGKEASPAPADLNRDEYGARVRAKLLGLETIPPASGYQLFAPTIDVFLKEHLFADIFVRDNLDFQTRELTTISALAAMSGTAPQLQSHLGISMNVGFTEVQLKQFIAVINSAIGKQQAEIAATVLEKILTARRS